MGVRFLKIAVIYLVIGVLLGLIMGILEDFRFASVHAHINLLGWVSMALFGLIYHYYPQAGHTGLAKTHFWLHNIGLPFMQGNLFYMLLTDNHDTVIITILSSIMVVIGVILFAINLFVKVNKNNSTSTT